MAEIYNHKPEPISEDLKYYRISINIQRDKIGMSNGRLWCRIDDGLKFKSMEILIGKELNEYERVEEVFHLLKDAFWSLYEDYYGKFKNKVEE